MYTVYYLHLFAPPACLLLVLILLITFVSVRKNETSLLIKHVQGRHAILDRLGNARNLVGRDSKG